MTDKGYLHVICPHCLSIKFNARTIGGHISRCKLTNKLKDLNDYEIIKKKIKKNK